MKPKSAAELRMGAGRKLSGYKRIKRDALSRPQTRFCASNLTFLFLAVGRMEP